MLCYGSNSKTRQWTAAIIGSSTVFVMGMVLGWSSPVIDKIHEEDTITLTDDQISWIVSLTYLGSIISPLPTGLIMDRYGRKIALYFTAIQGISTWVLLLATDSVIGIYISRVLGGMVGGSGITIVPIYISEIATPELRGGMNGLFALFMFSGVLIEFVLGTLTSYRTYTIVSFVIVILLSTTIILVPESPYYYTMMENKQAALESLTWLRSSNSYTDVEDELSIIEKTVSEKRESKNSVFDLVKSQGNRRAMFLTQTLAIIQRATGISLVIAYASAAAPSSWVLTNNQCTVLLGLTWIIFSFLSTKLADRFGRRTLFIISCAGCGLAQASYGVFDYLESNVGIDLSSYDWFPFAALVLFSMSYPVGAGCVPLIIMGEVFPSNVKGIASGVTSIILAAASFIVNKIYQPISEEYGIFVNYWIYAVFCAIGVIFAFFVLIETKGKTLLDIQTQLSRK